MPLSMMPRRAAFASLLWAAAVHATALFLFTTGFFLTRFEVPDVSDCRVPPDASRTSTHLRSNEEREDAQGCWMPRRFRRVVFVVVDALRFDFVQSSASSTASSRSFFLDHVPILNTTLATEPSHALLLKFVADAPTMTMQRLKGLTTGGLPTFLDIKDNMASSEITEDNLLLQLNRVQRSIVFMGDDTWDALYQHAFARKYAFDSFNVKDLHSVDRGVVRHLFPELQNDDWDMLIAHFLGVDHVGHTHGPSSPFMAEKLDEMNDILTKLIDELSQDKHDDTLLLIMGDHGMSADGNHGGASDDETGAALFVYSKQRLLGPQRTTGWPHEVPQVDLVPTIALLAGLPIPFGNLGAVIPQLFTSRENLVQALRLNVAQVRRYLLTYSAASKLPQSDFDHLERLYDTLTSLEDRVSTDDVLDDLVVSQQAYLREALALGRSIWTQFDLIGMVWGIVLLLVGQGLVMWHLMGDPLSSSGEAVIGAVGGAAFGLIAPSALGFLPRSRFARALALGALGSCISPALGRSHAVSSLLIAKGVRRPSLPTSCSVVAFTTVLLHALALLSNSYIVAEDRVMHFLTATVGCFLLWSAQRQASTTARRSTVYIALVFVVASRILGGLEPPNIIQSTTSLVGTWVPLMALVGGYIVGQFHQRLSLASLFSVLWAAVACAVYWYYSPIASSFWRLWLPRSVFLLALGSLVLRIRTSPSIHTTTDSTPLVLLVLAYALVLGPSSPLCLLCLTLQHASFFAVAFHCVPIHLNRLPLAWLWLWCAVCYQSFFTTGHQNTFTSLQNAAGFVGFDDFRFYWAGALLGFNTFGCYALTLLALAWVSPTQSRLAVVAYFALNALVSTAFVALQRRHLMVWAIFAPKFIFDGATLLVVEVLALVSLVIVPTKTLKTHTPLE